MADTPNSALGTNKKMAETDIALVKKMYCGKLRWIAIGKKPRLKVFFWKTIASFAK